MFSRHSLLLLLAFASAVPAQSTIAFEEAFRADADLLQMEFAPAATTVGDPDSFGRNVRWLGLLQSGTVELSDDCRRIEAAADRGLDDRCIELSPPPATTTFEVRDIGRMQLPAGSAHSMLCHALTPIVMYRMHNPTGVTQSGARLVLSPYVVLHSPVLEDPRLIDPATGRPFRGRLELGLGATFNDLRSLTPGEFATLRHSNTRGCIAGFLSRRNLIAGTGLSEAEADAIFANEIELRFGLRGSAAFVSNFAAIYGMRVTGD